MNCGELLAAAGPSIGGGEANEGHGVDGGRGRAVSCCWMLLAPPLAAARPRRAMGSTVGVARRLRSLRRWCVTGSMPILSSFLLMCLFQYFLISLLVLPGRLVAMEDHLHMSPYMDEEHA